jgi:hypothetical protein
MQKNTAADIFAPRWEAGNGTRPPYRPANVARSHNPGASGSSPVPWSEPNAPRTFVSKMSLFCRAPKVRGALGSL